MEIGFVPTMGALHRGHMALVEAARSDCGFVVTSIFVNPIQFGDGEDYEIYPRNLSGDLKILDDLKTDVAFCPTVEEMFPLGKSNKFIKTQISVPDLERRLCGVAREGHFTGMLTEVVKTFMIVQPDFAYFGEKDFQQLSIVERAVADLNLTVDIRRVATVRESDGLACSSRNLRLNHEQRLVAQEFYSRLRQCGDAFREGASLDESVSSFKFKLECLGFKVEYCDIVDERSLQSAPVYTDCCRALAAVWLGNVRLIDNIKI